MKTNIKSKYNILFAVNKDTELKQIQNYICDVFGGYSTTRMRGGWKDNETKEVIEEVSYKIEIITDKNQNLIQTLCNFIKEVANQKEVFYYKEMINLIVC